MSDEPLSELARELLIEASRAPKGLPIKGRDQKQASRALVLRGFGQLNKSGTRLNATSAGHFVADCDFRKRGNA